jgi:hypothetical protein
MVTPNCFSTGRGTLSERLDLAVNVNEESGAACCTRSLRDNIRPALHQAPDLIPQPEISPSAFEEERC